MNGTDRRDEILRRATRDYNAPPPVPREEIWTGIGKAREAADRERFRRARFLRRARVWAPAAAAAVLAIGFGLGRQATRHPAPESVAAPAVVAQSDFTADAEAYRQATYPLLDSPAAADPEMRHLLQDLELSLVRLAHLSAGRRDQAGWIDDTLTRKALLSRLRQATPADDIVRF